jgi:hypothetical protein
MMVGALSGTESPPQIDESSGVPGLGGPTPPGIPLYRRRIRLRNQGRILGQLFAGLSGDGRHDTST